MKQSKKLTYSERAIVSSWGLNPRNWRRVKLFSDTIMLQNVLTEEIREIPNRKKGEYI